ncbi:MAG TPA: OmpW family outer membrane protein [Burkholderiaceae bacterium]
MPYAHRFALVMLAVSPLLAAAQARDDAGDWIVRARATYLNSANKDGTGLGLSINDKTLPELDVTRFFTPNVAAELVLTYPQKQTISAGGTPIGSLKHLPPALLLQYHLSALGPVRPYAGVGVNWTHFSDVQFDAATTTALHPSIKKDSFGAALQAGLDVPVGGGWLLNADAKWVQIRTDVKSSGAKVGTFRVDPWLLSLGAGYRF